MKPKCTAKTEIWARICGFFRPLSQWNKGKQQEYSDRLNYQTEQKPEDRNPSP